jgi:Kef-type K+ transport system membrane component KefB
VAGRALGWLLARVGQPRVIGELLAGIAFGPSLLGLLAPAAAAAIMPPSVVPGLALLSQIGMALYMFLVGLELSADHVRTRARVALTVSPVAIGVPFVAGVLLARGVFAPLAGAGATGLTFPFFLGIALSITAFPVLARILRDRGLLQTDIGATALTCAATNDVVVWCAMAVLIGLTQGATGQAVATTAGAVAFIALMLVAVRPAVERLTARGGTGTARAGAGTAGSSQAAVVALAGMGVASAVATHLLGIHAVFGAFVAGLIVPHDSPAAAVLARWLAWPVALLLPAFFAVSGIRTELGGIAGLYGWLLCLALIAVAMLGTGGGAAVAARAGGMPWPSAVPLGILLSTRGLMELVVANIGLERGLIGPPLFSMLVVMALVTTVATSPLLAMLAPALQSRGAGELR